MRTGLTPLRRLLVRAVISNIEGQMAAIRENLLFVYHHFTTGAEELPEAKKIAAKLNLDFPVTDYFLLVGKRLKDVKRGNSVIGDEILCVEKTIKVFFNLHGRIFGHQITPTEEADGWQALMKIKAKHNKLTHPKCAADLEVTDEQAREALVVFIWMKQYLERIGEVEGAKWESIYDEFIKKA